MRANTLYVGAGDGGYEGDWTEWAREMGGNASALRGVGGTRSLGRVGLARFGSFDPNFTPERGMPSPALPIDITERLGGVGLSGAE